MPKDVGNLHTKDSEHDDNITQEKMGELIDEFAPGTVCHLCGGHGKPVCHTSRRKAV